MSISVNCLRLRIVVRRLPAAALQREPLGELVRRARCTTTDPALLRIFDVIHTRPLLSIIGLCGSAGSYGGFAHRCSLPQCSDGRFGAGKRDGTFSFGSRVGMSSANVLVLVRVEHDELAVSGRHGVDVAAGVHRRMVLVGRDLVVHERVVVADVPQRDDEIALDAFRPCEAAPAGRRPSSITCSRRSRS